MNLLYVTSECAPFSKTGGLADVLGALPKEMAKGPHDVRVVSPYYPQHMPEAYKDQLEDITHFQIKVGWRDQYVGLKRIVMDGVTYYFVDHLGYFGRAGLYGYDDDGERFAYFSQVAIEMLEVIDFYPDIMHCNDWQTAMIPVLLKDKYTWKYKLRDIKIVLTIHNLLFQGIYDQIVLSDLFGIGYDAFHEHGLKYYDKVNYLKGGIYYADLITTVSPTYAREIQTPEFGCGLDQDLRNMSHQLVGITNGIDYSVFNPETDERIVANFTVDDLSGKLENKLALQERVGLPRDSEIALLGIVTRLDEQKGIQLLIDSLDDLLNYRDVQLVLLGTGRDYYEEAFRYYTDRYPDQFAGIIDFDVDLAQLIYAGSDGFLMPSVFEPCGLSQLNSMRYGTLPIVHEVGGLADTVEPYNHETASGTGFSFHQFDKGTFLWVIDHALTVYYDYPDQWYQMQLQAMSQDNSWEKAAKNYLREYKYLAF